MSNQTTVQKHSILRAATLRLLFPKKAKKFIQKVIGTFLYYARCVNSTMLAVLGSLATQQANPTENTMAKVAQFLDYAATHPDAIVIYQASNMVLAGHSDVSYLSESNARSPTTPQNHPAMAPFSLLR